MECNKDEAKRAMDIALKKLSKNDYIGAKKLLIKAQRLYQDLDGLKHVLAMINVYISASSNKEGEIDFYDILGVDPTADDETLKRHYKKLALLIHPDKNKCREAEGAFKLVLEAWSTLSDKANRLCYDQKKRKWEEAKTEAQKQPNPHKPEKSSSSLTQQNPSSRKARKKYKGWTKDSTSETKGGMFWTMCNRCKTQCAYLRDTNVNKAILCSNCGQTFIATETNPWSSSSSQQQEQEQEQWQRYQQEQQQWQQWKQQQWSSQAKATSDASSFSNTSAQEKLKRWFKESQENLDGAANAAEARDNNANKAERPFKKPAKTENPNSTFEAERLFKRPMPTGNMNSTLEAERLFKRPMGGVRY